MFIQILLSWHGPIVLLHFLHFALIMLYVSIYAGPGAPSVFNCVSSFSLILLHGHGECMALSLIFMSNSHLHSRELVRFETLCLAMGALDKEGHSRNIYLMR